MSRLASLPRPTRRARRVAGTLTLAVGALAAPAADGQGYTFTRLDVPGSPLTVAQGINDAGQVVGWYDDATGRHGFLATLASVPTTVPEPGTLALVAAGVAVLGGVARRRRSGGAPPGSPR